MKKERHKWDILLAEAKVDGQQLHDLNRDIKDSEHLRVFTKAMNAIGAGSKSDLS
jgi:hypothetical protein